jgi:hypothetical protein
MAISSRKTGLRQEVLPNLVRTELKSHSDGVIDFKSDEGKVVVAVGDYVLTQSGYAGGGIASRVYKRIGIAVTPRLGRENYTNTDWELQRASGDEDHGSADGSTAITTSQYVLTAVGYAAGGIASRVYKYLGADATIDLSAADYSVTSVWELQANAAGKDHDTNDGVAVSVALGQFIQVVAGFNGGGTATRVYKKLAATGNVTLSTEDYSAGANWAIQATTYLTGTEATRDIIDATRDIDSINQTHRVRTNNP